MPLLRRLIQTICVLLVAVFGAVAAFAAPYDWSQASYPFAAQKWDAQPVNLTYIARAPLTTSSNVMVTGAAFAQTGNLHAFDGVGSTGAVYALLHSAPNRASDEPLLLENRFPNSNPPEDPNFPIISRPSREGERIEMAVDPEQINPAKGQIRGDKIGGFGTPDRIESVDQVRNDLAVRDDWKRDPSYVQELEIRPGTQIQESTVGPQTNPDGAILPGGGRQVEILVPPSGRSDVLRPVGPARPIE